MSNHKFLISNIFSFVCMFYLTNVSNSFSGFGNKKCMTDMSVYRLQDNNTNLGRITAVTGHSAHMRTHTEQQISTALPTPQIISFTPHCLSVPINVFSIPKSCKIINKFTQISWDTQGVVNTGCLRGICHTLGKKIGIKILRVFLF